MRLSYVAARGGYQLLRAKRPLHNGRKAIAAVITALARKKACRPNRLHLIDSYGVSVFLVRSLIGFTVWVLSAQVHSWLAVGC